MVGKKAVLMFVLLSLGLVAATFHPAQSKLSAKIDFSGFAEGDIVGSLSVGTGISGDPIEGFVSVFGLNPRIPGKNTAMIFDANCTDGCTGEDDDLDFSRYNLGPVLIISEDLDLKDPDDADNEGAEFWFDFSEFDDGKVKVNRLTVADVDDREFGEIHVYQGGRNGTLVKTVQFEETPDNEIQTVEVDVKDIDYMVVDLNGSGAIDNIEIEVEEPPPPQPKITLDGTCEPEGQYSEDLRLMGTLKQNGDPIANHAINLNLPDGNTMSMNTDQAGKYSYLFKGARNYIGQVVTASATVDGQKTSDTHKITETDFAGCSPGVILTLQGICEPQGQLSNDLRLTGKLTLDGNPIPNHPISLEFPDGNTTSIDTEEDGSYSHLFEDARQHIGKIVTAVATVDGLSDSDTHPITEGDFEECFPVSPSIIVRGTCEPKGQYSEDLRLTGTLTGSDGSGVPNHPITLDLPDRSEIITLNTDQAGNFSYLFENAYQYLDNRVLAKATFEGESLSGFHDIKAPDFEDCKDKPKQYVCKKVLLTTFHGQPIELGSQIPGWGLVDTHIVCRGIGQGKSCRLVIKGQPGYVVKSKTLEMDVPRLEPYVQYQAQIKGYDGAWTNKGCEFSFITGGRVASVSSHLADQVDSLGWVYLGQGRNAIKPLGVCSGWNDGCLFADNIIGFHFDDIYGNPLPGSELAEMQPGDRISIYRDHRLHTYEFTGTERVRQSAEGNQAILEAAEQHDLVLTTCSGYRLIDAGRFSHTRYATFQLLPRVEPQHQWQ